MISVEEFLRDHAAEPRPDPGHADARVDASSGPAGATGAAGHAGARVDAGTRTDGGASDLDACREAALRLLDAAPRSSGALRERLLGKGYGETLVDEVIDRLIQVGLLDDRAYAESVVRHCCERHMGRRGAMGELMRRGVDRPLAEYVASEAESQGMFEESVWELGRLYERRTHGLDPAVRRRRFWSAGGRKGHSPEALGRVSDELFGTDRK